MLCAVTSAHALDTFNFPVTFRNYMQTISTEDELVRSAADVSRMTQARIDSNAGSRRDALLRDIARPMRALETVLGSCLGPALIDAESDMFQPKYCRFCTSAKNIPACVRYST